MNNLNIENIPQGGNVSNQVVWGVREEMMTSLGQNVLVVGSAGTGKTYSYILPHIMDETQKNLIVFDTRQELYHQTYEHKQRQGYTVKQQSMSEWNEEIVQDIVSQLLDGKVIIYLHLDLNLRSPRNPVHEQHFKQLFTHLYEKLEMSKGDYQGIHILMDEAQSYRIPGLNGFIEQGKRCNVQISLSIQYKASLDQLYGEEEAEQMIKQCALLVMGINSHEDIQYFSSFVKEPFINEEDKRAAISYIPRGEAFWVPPYARKGQFIRLLDRENIQENIVNPFSSSENIDPSELVTLKQLAAREIVEEIFQEENKEEFICQVAAGLLEALVLYIGLENPTDSLDIWDGDEDDVEKMEKLFKPLNSEHPAYEAYIPFQSLDSNTKVSALTFLKDMLITEKGSGPIKMAASISTSL
ncbi:type IV secretory system conjugative DNA transfer family protein [Priestia endophytica]|uniref:type IV secretory system conjugative DNA transfer family protein n=1 Tax=Priestia endophytica TaxID=135735 RepID=UPI00124D12AF|nr:type IV secretory system conjugative DNA transfer family protein [Priestia endophytica]KAB2488186.1 TraM recognition domain-containing protein [Priestia endophytica]